MGMVRPAGVKEASPAAGQGVRGEHECSPEEAGLTLSEATVKMQDFQDLPDDALVPAGLVKELLAERERTARLAAERQATLDMWVLISTRDYLEERPWGPSTVKNRISGRGPTRRASGGGG